jgi:hypothetical protein
MFSNAVCFFNGHSMPVEFVCVGQKRKCSHVQTTAEERQAEIEKVVKRKARERVVNFLQFERDPFLDEDTKCERDNVGAISWTHYDNTQIACGITNVKILTQEDKLRDYNDEQREFTVGEHCGIHLFPHRLREIGELLRFAALAANSAGFCDFPENNDYKPSDWIPTSIKETSLSEEMSKLSDMLDIKRFVNEGQGDNIVGNLSWMNNGKMIYCPISAVVDLIENDNFEDVNSEEHQRFLENYGALSLFPIRLKELALHFENAAIAANHLQFPTIPDYLEDCSDYEEDDDDENEARYDADEESDKEDDGEDE